MSDRTVVIDFASPQFEVKLSSIGLEFGDASDELIEAQDIADLIRSQYGTLSEFLSDFGLEAAEVFIQLEGNKVLQTYSKAKVDFE